MGVPTRRTPPTRSLGSWRTPRRAGWGGPSAADPDGLAAWLDERAPDHVTWAGWEMIDAQESALGEPAGRPRVKIVRLDELLSASRPR